MLDLHVMRFVLLVGALVHCASAAFTNPKCQRMWDAKLAQYIALRDAHRQVVCVNGKGLVYPEKFTKDFHNYNEDEIVDYSKSARKGKGAIKGPQTLPYWQRATYDAWWPEWMCEDTQRIPIRLLGDGAKWMCGLDVLERIESPLVYSLGCNGDVMWEMDVRKRMPRAEMHVFGPITHKGWGTKVKQVIDPVNISLHEIWVHSKPAMDESNFPVQSLPKIMQQLQHETRVIDLLKVCQG